MRKDADSGKHVNLSNSGSRVLLGHQMALWQTLGILRCASRAAHEGESAAGTIEFVDLELALQGAIALLEPVCQRLEPMSMALDAQLAADHGGGSSRE